MSTNITEEHRRAFEALTRGEAGSFCLFSCFVSGEPPAVSRCPQQQKRGEPDYLILPPFVSMTSGMTLVDHDGREA